MKRLSDLTSYKGILPYDSELFGIYQPLLGWKSNRMRRRIATSIESRLADTIKKLEDLLVADYSLQLDPSGAGVRVDRVAPAHEATTPSFQGVVVADIARRLPPRTNYTPAIWQAVLTPGALNTILVEMVPGEANAAYHKVMPSGGMTATVNDPRRAAAFAAARQVVEKESRIAGLLLILNQRHQYGILELLFYQPPYQADALWATLQDPNDPFSTIDPRHDLDRVGLSPVGIAHLFSQYFFELDTFLGPASGHVWVSPGSTVELMEVHTRHVLVERTVEQSTQTTQSIESSRTQQDELSDAVKDDNRTDMKLGVNVSGSQNWVFGSATESASFNMDSTAQHAREQTHKTMRQQTEKLSSEIKKSFKTTFRTVTETTDLSSKRYTLTNATPTLINYELRRKMRQIAVQVQDVGSYLCWQTYVDDAGASLGLGTLVHVGAPPDLSQIPAPEMVVPPPAMTEEITISIPFLDAGNASNDQVYDKGAETTLGAADKVNHIHWHIKQGPVRCSQVGFRLANVVVDTGGQGAVIVVEHASIKEDPKEAGAFFFTTRLDHINFGGKDSISAKAELHWIPVVDQDAIKNENAKRLASFTARERQEFRRAYLAATRERIKLASNITKRRFDVLREEERTVVYRALIQSMLAPRNIVPQPDAQTQHVVAELLDSIFDVEKLLYFVAPEWWRPRRHESHQDFGGLEPETDPTTGEVIASPPGIPKQDQITWGGRGSRADNYFLTEDSEPAPLGASLGWLLQLDGDDMRNAFLNAPWVKAVLPIRPGREKAALNWLTQVEGMDGIGPQDIYQGPEPEWKNKKTMYEVLGILADSIRAKHELENQVKPYKDPLDPKSTINATPIDRVYEHGFDPLTGGFRAHVNEPFEIFDQWVEVLPTDQVAAVAVEYDPKTGRML